MSRIGKKPITIPKGVTVKVVGDAVEVQGPKGKMRQAFPAGVNFELADGHLIAKTATEEPQLGKFHGLARSLVANAVNGVTDGYKKELDIVGVGYRAEVKGKQVHLSLGYSHPVVFQLPEGVTAEVDKVARTEDSLPTIGLTLRSVDRAALGETAVKLRALRPPEPYKGKGIKYADERVRRKEGKTGTA